MLGEVGSVKGEVEAGGVVGEVVMSGTFGRTRTFAGG